MNHAFPPENAPLFADVRASKASRMIWPFADDVVGSPVTMRGRNLVLVALAEAVVVVQAHYRSGSRNAAKWARSLRRPLWVVPAAPWMGEHCGSLVELARGAMPLCSAEQFFSLSRIPGQLVIPPPLDVRTVPVALPKHHMPPPPQAFRIEPAPLAPPPSLDLDACSPDEKTVISSLSLRPMHVDEVVARTGLPLPPVVTALLTLSLKDVVVEGPNGFFRRRTRT